uniref:Fucosyltransferase n=1 Tax=Chromera velia CCMP2878 TaxID=1169474 RepID=A0A0G4G0W0_9ALVE|eukprot:Cvel_19591.t1-p1 / transcript=Cvel_19591.t1 / gene=Cvel_19591 / organism=Chromera_velia_CCMP2878 / gene_product=Putative fucosyltransferase-like protein, putative / transcript_product=Putative fucosyltransferase-like protein, putative / location=Cvel_scaffold1702:25185-27172(-) / protein_length=334 / sequence_SO=supercontig / SO=protein_coding / is_pseudo=false
MTSDMLGRDFRSVVPMCDIDCEWVRGDSGTQNQGHVLMYHAPTGGKRPPNTHAPWQRTGVYSMEGEGNYKILSDKDFLAAFDVRMTYFLDSEVPMQYYPTHWPGPDGQTAEEGALNYLAVLQEPPVPVSEKKNAMVWLQRKCASQGGRERVIRSLMDSGKVQVDSYGSCYNNMGSSARIKDKGPLFSTYKFCFTAENSVTLDYFTEKTLDGLAAGCLPVTNGPPNLVEDFLPHPKAAIFYNGPEIGGDWQKLEALLVRLMGNDEEYEEYMAWKKLSLSELSPGFQAMVERAKEGEPRCKMCKWYAETVYPSLTPEQQASAQRVVGEETLQVKTE